MSVIMGLDPASFRNMGLVIVKINKKGKNRLKILKMETVVFPDVSCDGERLRMCYDILSDYINQYKVTKTCMERSMGAGKIFVRNNLNEMAAAIKMASFDNEAELIEISPSHLKKVITGYGKASKSLIKQNVKSYFQEQLDTGKKVKRSEHEWDAAGIALCYSVDSSVVPSYVPAVIEEI